MSITCFIKFTNVLGKKFTNLHGKELFTVHKTTMSDLHSGFSEFLNIAGPHKCHGGITTLESLNDDCLLQIIQYLSLFQITNLSSTCTRLQKFAIDFVYPKMVQKVEIQFKYDEDSSFDSLSIYTTDMYYLEKPFESFGGSVEQLTFNGSYDDDKDYTQPIETRNLSTMGKLLDLCPNLHTLRIRQIDFRSDNIDLLNHVTVNLKELEFVRCTNTTNDWSEALKRFLKLEHLALTGSNETTADFFKSSSTLSSLDIDCLSLNYKAEDLEKIFVQNGSSLQKLRLVNFMGSSVYQSILTLVVKLPKLEYLAMEGRISQKLTDSLNELPHLKSLKLWCAEDESVNFLLRKLSDLGTIEDLDIEDGVFNNEDCNAAPLTFNQLKIVRWMCFQKKNLLGIFNA